MAETSSSPQAGGVGSSKHLARNHSLPASKIPCSASSVPRKDSISKRRRKGNRGHVLLPPVHSFQRSIDEQATRSRSSVSRPTCVWRPGEHERVQYPLSCFRCAGNECGVTHCQTLWPLDKLHIGKWMFKLTGFTRGFVRRVAAAGAQERIREDIQYTDGA
jgi:hypothetical protein